MNHRTAAARAMGRGRSDKRAAILVGALAVFARDGYARASIDAIAATADVSTRTIYNHFGDKAGLFAAVVQDSAAAVASAHIEQIDTILGAIQSTADLEDALVSCALALQTVVPPDAPHWKLVRHVHADAEHVPPDVVEAWRRLGPARAKRQLALHFSDLARRGLLRLDDPDTAAAHYSALMSSAESSALEPGPSPERARRLVRAAVSAFLYGYLPRD